MPIEQQIGTFVAGMFGTTIVCQLNPLQTDIFSNVTGVTLNMTRPDGTKITERDLGAGAITDVNGKLEFDAIDGDMPIEGIYSLKITIDKTGPVRLIFGGDFSVADPEA